MLPILERMLSDALISVNSQCAGCRWTHSCSETYFVKDSSDYHCVTAHTNYIKWVFS